MFREDELMDLVLYSSIVLTPLSFKLLYRSNSSSVITLNHRSPQPSLLINQFPNDTGAPTVVFTVCKPLPFVRELIY